MRADSAARSRPGRWAPAGILILLVMATYPVTLATLLRGLTLDTPLAYLALVPLITLLLVAEAASRRSDAPDIHDRYVDYIIGIPFLVAALLLVVVVPIELSTYFWSWRLDVLSVPLFTAGAVSVAFGFRTLWRLRLPIAFLLLAWPALYQLLLDRLMLTFTALTTAAIRALLLIAPVAQPTSGGDGSLFTVSHSGTAFVLAVASACSGVNGLVGFLLVGTAFAIVARGAWWRKGLWLLVGMAVIWSFNVLRILGVLAGGAWFGRPFAMDVLHPVAGLVAFVMGVLAMLVLLPTFQLRIATPAKPKPRGETGARSAVTLRRALPSLALVLAASLVGGIANLRMSEYQVVAGALGSPTVQAGSVILQPLPGWRRSRTASYTEIGRYLGADATWVRYVYGISPEAERGSGSGPVSLIYLDLMTTSDPNAFGTYTVQQCFRFHDFPILADSQVQLGGGVTGRKIAYLETPSRRVWAAVYWEWPVQAPAGLRYERVILHVSVPTTGLTGTQHQVGFVERVQTALAAAFSSSPTKTSPPEAGRALDFLAGFGRQLVSSAAQWSKPSPGRQQPSIPWWRGLLG